MVDSRVVSNKRISGLVTSLLRSKGLLANTISTMGFSVAILLVNVATGMITARMLGPEGRGDQAAMILWPQFLAFALTFGLHTSLLYHVKKSPEEEGEILYATIFWSALISLVAMGVGMIFIPIWVSNNPASIVPGQWFLLVIPFMHLFFILNALFRAREEFHLFNLMRYLTPVLTLAMLVLFIVADMFTPITSSLAYLLPYLPITVWALFRSLRLYRPKLQAIRATFKRVLRYGAGSYGIDLLGTLVLYIDQIILIGLLAPGPLGLYVVAVSLSRMVNVFSSSIIMVLFPKASELEAQEAALLSLRVYKLSTAIAVLGSAVIVLAAPIVIHLLYGADFLASIPVFRLLLLDVVIGGAVFVLGQSFMAVGKPSVVAISQAIGLAILIPLLYVLVPQYGILGAGVALITASVARLIYMVFNFERRFRFGYRAQLITMEDCRWFMSNVKSRKRA
jgi:O-antigen/teichoic acid export membrane protein